MLSTHFAEELIELLVSHSYVASYGRPLDAVPGSSLGGFIRFLGLLAEFPFHLSPLVIPPHDHDEDDDPKPKDDNKKSALQLYKTAREAFDSKKKSCALLCCCEFDPTGHLFDVDSGRAPERPVLRRATQLARASLSLITEKIMSGTLDQEILSMVFRPSLEAFDMVITLQRDLIPALPQGVDAKYEACVKRIRHGPMGRNPRDALYLNGESAGSRKRLTSTAANGHSVYVGLHPVREYVEALRESHGDKLLFFVDLEGGDRIGCVWRPSARAARRLSVANTAFSKPVEADGTQSVELNVPEVIDDIKRLGLGFVIDVETK